MENKPQVVLSVDDNDVDGALLERAFKRTNMPAKLFRVSEGPQAMCYLAGEGIYQDRENYPLPDLVLLDLVMPKMSGMEVLKWIKGQQILKKTKVLIFTASEKPEDQQNASSAGADGFLLKPTKFDDLKKLVKNVHEEWLCPKPKKAAKANTRKSRVSELEEVASPVRGAEAHREMAKSAGDIAIEPSSIAQREAALGSTPSLVGAQN
ncbi:MAG: response regulator [Verrucomicrobiales bacterium]